VARQYSYFKQCFSHVVRIYGLNEESGKKQHSNKAEVFEKET